ncbi:LuxR C-terminal-related transcriptional regulator [Streptomyces sp. 2112.3]|uniref:helix-turn-helix transcriptional regulator n=1 Tax=Streptomyces sp. 2112.3 TaxID=1881023 RepID=UPI002109FDAA|nr:LuxR C-terminal-related transcriptional regulator [Streptomyces sp. 2112.3]
MNYLKLELGERRAWDVVTSHFDRLAAEALPGAPARSRTAAGTRARVIAELGEAYAAALTGVLGVLRSRTLDDAAARATATDLAVSALVELRAEAERDQEIAEEPPPRPSPGSPTPCGRSYGTAPYGWSSVCPLPRGRWGTTVSATLPLRVSQAPAPDPLTALGERELQVLARLALGHRNRAIAQELHISESTVKFHVAKVLTKLGVGSRGEAAALFHTVA